jgi:hypothetical protein|nr:hypothetical protein [Neorhizobium tomejilense]
MVKQRSTIIGGKTVRWTERGNGLSAFHRGFAITVERVLPRPEAITSDRVVVAMTPWTFRTLINGELADTDREFVATIDEAMEIVTSAVADIVEPLEAAMAELSASKRPIRYEDWA